MSERTVSVKYRMDVGGAIASTKALAGATRDLGKDIATATGGQKRNFDSLGRMATVSGGTLLLALGSATKVTMDFDKAISGVGAVSGATGKELLSLREAALKAGADTAFSARQAATAEAELAKAGVSTADILGGALSGSLSLAAAGQLDLGDAATISAQAMNVFKLGGKDVGHIADVLAAGANKSAVDVGQLGEAMRAGGLVAAQTGLTLEDTVGVLAAFGDRALIGSDAGTSLKTMLQRLNPQSDAAAASMEQLGIHAYDTSGQFIGLDKLAGQLQTGMSGLTTEQRNAALATIFGSDAVRGANVLYELGETGIRKYTSAVNDTGAAGRMAATQMDNLSGDLEKLKGSLETALIKVGSQGTGVLRGLTQGADGLVNAFSNAPAAVQGTVTVLGGLAGAAGLGGGALLLLLPRVNDTRKALQEMGLTGPKVTGALKGLAVAGTVVGGVALLGTGLKFLQDQLAREMPGANALQVDLLDLGNTGRSSGPVLDALGGSFEDLGWKVQVLARPDNWDKFAAGIAKVGTLGQATSGDMRAAKDSLSAVDGALSQLVARGQVDQAATAFNRLATEAAKQGVSVDDLRKVLPQYRDALAGVEVQSKIAADDAARLAKQTVIVAEAHRDEVKAAQHAATQTESLTTKKGNLSSGTQRLTTQIDLTAGALNDEKSAADRLKGAIDSLIGVNLSAEQADSDWRESIAGLTGAVKDNNKNIDLNSAKGRTLRGVIRENITKAEAHAAAITDQTGSVDKGNAAFGRHIEKLKETLRRAGLTEGQIKDLTKTYGLVPKKVETATSAPGARKAKGQIDDFRQSIRAIEGKTVPVIVSLETRVAALRQAAGGGVTRSSATGGLVRGPGGPEDDKAGLYNLSDYEYVTRSRIVREQGSRKFDLLNQGKARIVPKDDPAFGEEDHGHLATGGLVRVNTSSRGADASLDRVLLERRRGLEWQAREVARIKKLEAALGGALGGGRFSPGGGRGWPPRRYGVVSANTRAAGDYARSHFGVRSVGYLGSRSYYSDHPWGKAADLMTFADTAKGNRVASYFVNNPGAFGTKYAIFNRRINSGSGWRAYAYPGRGSTPTTRHEDHVHLSLMDRGGLLGHRAGAVNLSGRPERVLSPDETRRYDRDQLRAGLPPWVQAGSQGQAVALERIVAAIERQSAVGAAAPLIGELNMPVQTGNPRQVAEEVMYQVRLARRGARVG